MSTSTTTSRDLEEHLSSIELTLRMCPRAIERAGKAVIKEIRQLASVNPRWHKNARMREYVYYIFPAEVFTRYRSWHSSSDLDINQTCEANLRTLQAVIREFRETEGDTIRRAALSQRQLLSTLLNIPNPPKPLDAGEFIDPRTQTGYIPCLGDIVKLDVSDWVDSTRDCDFLSEHLTNEYHARRQVSARVINIRKIQKGTSYHTRGLFDYKCDLETRWHETIRDVSCEHLTFIRKESRPSPPSEYEHKEKELQQEIFSLNEELIRTQKNLADVQAELVQQENEAKQLKAELELAKTDLLNKQSALDLIKSDWRKEHERVSQLEGDNYISEDIHEEAARACMPENFPDLLSRFFMLSGNLPLRPTSRQVVQAEVALYQASGATQAWFESFSDTYLDEFCKNKKCSPAVGHELLKAIFNDIILQMEDRIRRSYFLHESGIVF